MINEKQFQDILKELLKIQDCETAENLLEAVLEKLKFLFNEKEYAKVVLLFHNNICYPKDSFYVFEVAYSLAENEAFIDEAEIVYSNLLKSDPKNVAVLNNLAIIKENKNKIEEAHGLIKLSHELEPHNELYTRNYTRILPKYEDIIKYNDNYKSSLAGLQKENDFVITKLNAFIINVMNDSTFKSGRIPIPAWKFTELMNTDKQKAESLKEQWLKKYYIRNTEDRGEHNELIYELNPFLKQEIEKINNRKLNVKWIEGIEALSLDTLDEFHYFDIKEKLQKINQKYRQIVTRDFDELVMNYVMKNAKSVLILSGSLIETLLMYYCEKKKLTTITYQRNNKNISKSIYECDLGDLLIYFEQNKYLGELVPPLGNVSRIHRNYVHPGKELRESETLDDSKISLCFISTIEIIKQIVN